MMIRMFAILCVAAFWANRIFAELTFVFLDSLIVRSIIARKSGTKQEKVSLNITDITYCFSGCIKQSDAPVLGRMDCHADR
jgi:hypothetical protein